MSASITVYLTNTADTLVTTANQLSTTAPSSATHTNTSIGNNTGWGVVFSQGTTNPWAAGASEPTFGNVNGFILDSTILEGTSIDAGTWTANMFLNVGKNTITADIHVRVGKRSSTGVYTQIVDITQTGASIGAAAALYTFTGSTGSSTSFAVGDKLYIEIDLNITANGQNATTLQLNMNGGSNESVVSPGSALAPSFLPQWASRTPFLHGGAFLAA